MDKQKLVSKLIKKYPELDKEPLFDELISIDSEEDVGEEELPMEEGDLEAPEEEVSDEEMDKVFGKSMFSDEEGEAEEPAEMDIEDEMLSEAANSDKMMHERLRDKMKAKKYGSRF